MNLNSMYENFIKDTGLSDPVFKSVFSKVYEVLESISKLHWDYVSYTDHDSVEKYDFKTIKKIPLYMVEVMRNIFEDYFTLPKNVTVELGVTFESKQYKITSTHLGTTLPAELVFIKQNNIFDIFCCLKPVYDIFDEFNNLFRFSKEFSMLPDKIYPPLAKKFDTTTIRTQQIEGDIIDNKILENEQIIISIQRRLQEIFAKSNTIKIEREELSSKLAHIESGISSRTDLLKRKEILSIDLGILHDTIERHEERIASLNTVIKDIDAEITDLNNFQENKSDLNYFLEKKEIFHIERKTVEDSYTKANSFCDNVKTELNSIKEVLNEIDDYDMKDLTDYQNRIKEIDNEIDELSDLALQLESDIKQRQREINSSRLKIEKTQINDPVSLERIEMNSIKDHLYSPAQPKSVLAVINYLRYFYAYHVTVHSKELIDEYKNIDSYLIQAIVSRLVLAKNFGISMSCLFSILSFSDENIGQVISITRE